jgi:hypothetical protein
VTAIAACNPSPKISQDAPNTPASTSATTPASATTSATASATTSTGTVAKNVGPTEAPRDNGIKIVMAGQETDALSLVRTERLKAKAEGRVLVVYAGAGWCEPCKRFKNAVQTGALDEKLAKTTLLVFDADRDTDRLASAGYKFSFIPYVALPGTDGHPSDTAEAKSKGSESWRELISKLESWQTK